MEKHVCSAMVPDIGGDGIITRRRIWRHCMRNATAQVPPTNNWYCSTHATELLNKENSPERKAFQDRLNNTKPPSQCRLEKCDINRIQPGENSQECIGCTGLKFLNWMPKR